MCDICAKAAGELADFCDELENKYPATEVRGKKVPRGHHVTAALIGNTKAALIRDQIEMALSRIEAEEEAADAQRNDPPDYDEPPTFPFRVGRPLKDN